MKKMKSMESMAKESWDEPAIATAVPDDDFDEFGIPAENIPVQPAPEVPAPPTVKDVKLSDNNDNYITFISKLEAFKTKCKNLHWSAPNEPIHVRLDEFLGIISDYEDSIAEEVMGMTKQFKPTDINPAPFSHIQSITNASDFIEAISKETNIFYDSLCPHCAGLKSETETFIHNINKYKYLFSLCH